MKMNKFKKGDLVFIPSEVRLIQFQNEEKSSTAGLPLFINNHTTTRKPNHVILMDSFDKYCKIYYNGEYWFADKEDVYGDP
tara:strand:+ start:7248 stop:7490 length:243 start_codon:yes stop_codon:yes gene_type:complete